MTREHKIKWFIFVYSCSDLHAEQFHCKITKTLYTKPLFAAYLILYHLPFLPSGLCRRQTAKPSDTGNGIAAGNLRGISLYNIYLIMLAFPMLQRIKIIHCVVLNVPRWGWGCAANTTKSLNSQKKNHECTLALNLPIMFACSASSY